MTVSEQARRRAHEELSKPEYAEAGPGWLKRVLVWALERIDELLDASRAAIDPAGRLVAVATLVLVAGFLIVVHRRIGRIARGTPREPTLFLGRARTAAEHRQAADAHADAGRWEEAVRERLRAVVRALEERGLLDPRPGRTALETAADGGAVLPGCAAGLRTGAELFDAIWYGGARADASDYAALLMLDRQVAAARPVPRPGAAAAAGPTVPSR